MPTGLRPDCDVQSAQRRREQSDTWHCAALDRGRCGPAPPDSREEVHASEQSLAHSVQRVVLHGHLQCLRWLPVRADAATPNPAARTVPLRRCSGAAQATRWRRRPVASPSCGCGGGGGGGAGGGSSGRGRGDTESDLNFLSRSHGHHYRPPPPCAPRFRCCTIDAVTAAGVRANVVGVGVGVGAGSGLARWISRRGGGGLNGPMCVWADDDVTDDAGIRRVPAGRNREDEYAPPAPAARAGAPRGWPHAVRKCVCGMMRQAAGGDSSEGTYSLAAASRSRRAAVRGCIVRSRSDRM